MVIPVAFLSFLAFMNPFSAAQEPPAKGFEVKPDVWQRYLGEYMVSGKEYVSVFKFSQQAEDGSLFFFDSDSGRTGPLEAVSEREFVGAGPGAGADSPAGEIRMIFLKNGAGETDRMILKRGGRPDGEARRDFGFTEVPVTFPSDGVTIAGSLRLPPAPGRHPAVVYAHGSGPGTGNQISLLAHFFLHMGIAVLGYDKRGVGASTGDWRRIDFPELASDALAAVRYLRSRPDIDPQKDRKSVV